MDNAQKEAKYSKISKQIKAVVAGENNAVAKMATISCLLKAEFDYFYWCGFYMVDQLKPSELVIGPYQGTLGCLRIPYAKGVCGLCASSEESQIVDDVHKIENHIACDPLSSSEIVVPVFHDGKLIAVLDVDSKEIGSFNEVDKSYLEEIISSAF